MQVKFDLRGLFGLGQGKYGELDTCKLSVMDRVTLHNIIWKLGKSKIDY